MKSKLQCYIRELNLVATSVPKIDRPVYRRPGFDGILTPQKLDDKVAEALSKTRVAKKLTRAQLAVLFGSAAAAYGRYEKGITKLTAARIIQLCETLRILPEDLFFDAAPHLWGENIEEAQKRRSITTMVQGLHDDKLDIVTTVLEGLLAMGKAKAE